ncbi:hypothetical protein Taro_025927 [Colocasia esculenta]|uniref:Uncharacterized protein n=1 Tax=Colocasia esculenta TaxID=4460 RepID=A0A843V4S0_COLES|nr:hypothetical protein [Colocasia esculenta]
MVAPEEPATIGFGSGCARPSRSSRDGGGRRVLVAASGGAATAFLTDLIGVLSVRTVLSGVSFPMYFPYSPPPVECDCAKFGVVSERIIPEPLSDENATAIEVTMMSRPPRPPRHHRNSLGCLDTVVTARWVVTIAETVVWWSRHAGSMEFSTVVFSVPLVVSSFASALPFVGETSQQRQGAHWAEETGR